MGTGNAEDLRLLAHELRNTIFATDMLLERALEHEELGTDPMEDVRRAREGLRRLYLQQHVARATHPECGWACDRLGGLVRGRLAARDRARLDAHLVWCADCRSRLDAVTEADGDGPCATDHEAGRVC